MKPILLATFIFISCCVFSQKPDTVIEKPLHDSMKVLPERVSESEPEIQNPEILNPTVTKSNHIDLMSNFEFGLSIGVLAFGLILIVLEMHLIKTKKISEELLVKFILITLIVTSTLFLITAGYDNNQIAPAMGLFGSIAGYLLGRSMNNNKPNKDENNINNET